MGSISRKLCDPAERCFQPLEHAIQRLGKALQLVAAPWDIKSLREIVRVDLLSRSGDLIHGRQSPPAQPIPTSCCKDENERAELQNDPLEPIDSIVEIIHRGRHLNAIPVAARVHFSNHNPEGKATGLKVVSRITRGGWNRN